MSRSKLWPHLMLLAAALIWGSSFLIMKQAVAGVPVFFLLAVRFTAAALILCVIFCRRWKGLTRPEVLGGAVMGVLLFVAYALQTYGLYDLGGWQGTTAGKNAFLTDTYCVMVPFLSWLIFKKRPDRYNVVAGVCCAAGIGLVSVTSQFTVVGGDLLTLLGGVAFSLHIIAVFHFTQRGDTFRLTVIQFAVTALLSWLGAVVLWDWPTALLPPEDLWRLVYLAIGPTALALLFQNIGQSRTPPATAAVLLSLEAPSGVLFSCLFGEERPTPAMYCGFALIFFAILLSETKLSFLRRRKKVKNGG